MGTLFPKALYFKNTFCGCLFIFTENWNKTGEMTAKIFFFYSYYYDYINTVILILYISLYIKCIIQLFPHGPELKTKNKSQYWIAILVESKFFKKIAIHIVSPYKAPPSVSE